MGHAIVRVQFDSDFGFKDGVIIAALIPKNTRKDGMGKWIVFVYFDGPICM